MPEAVSRSDAHEGQLLGQRSRSARLENWRKGMTAPNPTPVIFNIYWEIFAKANLNDCIQKSWSAAIDPYLPDDVFMGNGGLLIIKLPVEVM